MAEKNEEGGEEEEGDTVESQTMSQTTHNRVETRAFSTLDTCSLSQPSRDRYFRIPYLFETSTRSETYGGDTDNCVFPLLVSQSETTKDDRVN